MEAYVTSTELKQELRRVKALARKDVVHVLENGHAGYVLCSADVFELKLKYARAKGAWRARATEVLREGRRAQACGQIRTIEYGSQYDSRVFITNDAAHELSVEYDGRANPLTEALAAVADDPNYGLSLEYDSFPAGAYKVLVPPNDILYTWDESENTILVCGFVRSLDASLASAGET